MSTVAQFRPLLENCQEMVFSHLRPLVDRMFENADVALLDFAEKAESNMAQSLFFDAMNEVRKKRTHLEQIFYTELKRGFSEFPARPEAAGGTAHEAETGGLSLVETDAVETFVATQNATGKLASRIMEKIFALKQRLAVVNGGHSIEENQIPGGPAWLGAAFQHAVEELELEHKVRLVFIALFDKYVLARADSLFDEYNKRLIQADILPNLRYEVRKQSGGIEIIEKQVEDPNDEPDNDAGQPENLETSQTPSELGDELFGRICELMSVRRGRGQSAGQGGPGTVSPLRPHAGDGQGAATGIPGGRSHGTRASDGDTAPGEAGAAGGGGSLIGQISHQQSLGASLASDEFIENIEIDEHLIERLQGTLADEREKILGAVDRRNLTSADTDIIELVGMMFEYMLKDEHLPNVVKALLSLLHTPLLKVAVIDRSFFTNQEHAARALLNDMTAAGNHWVDENDLGRGIFPKMREIVDKVLAEFKEDTRLFDEVLTEFNKAVDELKQRANRVEQRTNEAANGQERLQAARTRVQTALHDLLKGKTVAQPVCDFLQRILADKLTFILLRGEDAEQGAEWKQVLTLAEKTLDSVPMPGDTPGRKWSLDAVQALQQDIRDATGTLQQTDKEKTLQALFALQRRAAEGADISAVPTAKAPESPAEATQAEEAPQLTPEQREMLEKLRTVPFGTWFEFRKSDGSKRRAKLSWRSTVTEKYMFVDQMGVKAAVIGMDEVADFMLKGTVRILSAEKKPFVDRALNAIYRMLDHAA